MTSVEEKQLDPKRVYRRPSQVLDDDELTLIQKRAVLRNWLADLEHRAGEHEADAAPADAAAGEASNDLAREIKLTLDTLDGLSAVDTSRES